MDDGTTAIPSSAGPPERALSPNGRRGAWPLSSIVIGAVVVASLAIWVGTGGEIILALLPVAAAALLFALFRAPLRWIAAILLFLVLSTDDPKDHPALDEWRQPLYSVGLYLFENLNNITGVAPLRFAGVEVVLVLLLVVVTLRRKDGRLDPGFVPVPRALSLSVLVMFLTILWLELYGLATGGDFKSSLWQIRQMLWFGPVYYLFASMLRGPQDARALAAAIIGAGLWKVGVGFYFYEVFCRPRNIRPVHVNTHSETILYVIAAGVILANLLHKRGSRSALLAATVFPLIVLGIIINDRRIAYASLAASLAAAFAMLHPGRFKRRLYILILALSPLLTVYYIVGSSSSAMIFMPAQKVASLLSQKDDSSGTRDIENWNLVATIKGSPILGHGFGHEYEERVQADSIKEYFSLYLYIPHNSVLWLWLLGGLVGFTLMWAPFVVCGYFAIRSYRLVTDPDERTLALTCVGVIIVHELQQYGDMGTQYWMSTFVVPVAFAMAGKLAVKSGAWPRRLS